MLGGEHSGKDSKKIMDNFYFWGITLALSSTLYIQYIFSSRRFGGFLSFLRRELVSQSDYELIEVLQKLQASLYFFFVVYGLTDTEIGINEMVLKADNQ